MRRRILCSLLLVPLVGGCAVSKDGTGFAASPHAAQNGVLIVGTTGPLRALADAERATLYRDHVAGAARAQPVLTEAQFKEKIAGWASVETSNTPLVTQRRYRVLVPASAARDARSPSAVSFEFGAGGDLVAARSGPDGLLWIDRLLCRGGRLYGTCAQKYAIGVFDENTGRELGRDESPKRDGEWVDISSYLRLSKDPEHHSASELDVRAINRCDDCKGALPGSVRSSVSVPPP